MTNRRIDEFKKLLEKEGRKGKESVENSNIDITSATTTTTPPSPPPTPPPTSLILTFEGSNYIPLSVIKQCLLQLKNEPDNDQSWNVLGWACLSIYGHVTNHLLNQTLPISSGILYWDDILDSGIVGLGIYGIQIFPSWVYYETKKWFNQKRSFDLTSIPFKRIQPTSITEIVYMANPAYVYLRKSIKKNKREMIKVRDDIAKRLGLIVSKCWIDGDDDDGDIKSQIIKSIQILHREIIDDTMYINNDNDNNNLYKVDTFDTLDDDTIATTKLDPSSLPNLQQNISTYSSLALSIINQLPNDTYRYSPTLTSYGIPNTPTRYWPIATLSLYGLYKFLGNWNEISKWVKTELWETLVSFWQNRLIKPLYQIFETIRYDENDEITLISKKSLESDINSLQRMVIDLVTSTDKSISPELLQQKVEQGDLTDVLMHYEKQIQTPIKSIVSGELIRSLLIQIQKAKVDVEVAVSGIDKLLQSQQLVFGLIAALPAIGVTWWSAKAIINRTLEGNVQRRIKGRSNIKTEINTCLYNIKRILRKGEKQSSTLTPLGLGLLLCQTHLLRNLSYKLLPTSRYRQFTDDLDEVETASSISSKQLALDRIYWTNYF